MGPCNSGDVLPCFLGISRLLLFQPFLAAKLCPLLLHLPRQPPLPGTFLPPLLSWFTFTQPSDLCTLVICSEQPPSWLNPALHCPHLYQPELVPCPPGCMCSLLNDLFNFCLSNSELHECKKCGTVPCTLGSQGRAHSRCLIQFH